MREGPDSFAWRASDELRVAVEGYRTAMGTFRREVIMPFNAAHPGNESIWIRSTSSLNTTCVGFADDNADVPAGLSRNIKRGYLIPRRTKAGQSWQDMLTALNRRPSIDKVLLAHDVDPSVVDMSRGRLFRIGLYPFGDVLYVACGANQNRKEPSAHLIPVKLSEFYAAKEQQETEDARRAAEAQQGVESA